MGHKVNPIAHRLAITANWSSKWFAGRKLKDYLIVDLKVRDFIKKELVQAGIGRVEITRSHDRVAITITTSRPGLVIGRGGQGINNLKDTLKKRFFADSTAAIKLDIIEERRPDLSAAIVAQNIGSQVERRIPYRRACKMAVEKTMAAKARGIKIIISGRLNGAEIARKETFSDGTLPLSRMSNEIDYAVYHAKTTFGIVGLRVWINKPEEPKEEF